MRTETEKQLPKKKSYRAPRLVAHGNLRQLTMGAKGGPANDSGIETPVKSKASGAV